jgi:hypothetical protein
MLIGDYMIVVDLRDESTSVGAVVGVKISHHGSKQSLFTLNIGNYTPYE